MTATVTSPVAPDRSRTQRLAALQEANRIRSQRARMKDKLHDTEPTKARSQVAWLLTFPPHDLATMKVVDLLLATPKVGRVKANKWLSRARISPSKTLGGLSERQRAELAALIGTWR